jgi:hypothetical protein
MGSAEFGYRQSNQDQVLVPAKWQEVQTGHLSYCHYAVRFRLVWGKYSKPMASVIVRAPLTTLAEAAPHSATDSNCA